MNGSGHTGSDVAAGHSAGGRRIGLRLFAILSIIRLRSSAVSQQEVAHYFASLVMELVNGLDLDDRQMVLM